MANIVITTRPHTYYNYKTVEMVDGVVHEIGCTHGDGIIHEIVVVRLDPLNGVEFTIISNIWQSENIHLVMAALAEAQELIAEFQIANQH